MQARTIVTLSPEAASVHDLQLFECFCKQHMSVEKGINQTLVCRIVPSMRLLNISGLFLLAATTKFLCLLCCCSVSTVRKSQSNINKTNCSSAALRLPQRPEFYLSQSSENHSACCLSQPSEKQREKELQKTAPAFSSVECSLLWLPQTSKNLREYFSQHKLFLPNKDVFCTICIDFF